MGDLFLSFESVESSPIVLYTFDPPKNDKDRRALREVRAAGADSKVDLKHIEKQVLMRFEAYWSTASKRMVSQPRGGEDEDERNRS